MTASSDPATYGKLTAYVIPEPLPDGPLTVASNINQRFSRELTLIDQAGSEVRFGDLQIIPSGGGLIYVRPWFVQAVSSPIPVLDSISVTYSGRSEVGKSLSEALDKLFGVDVDIGDREADPDATTDTGEPGGEDPGTVSPGTEVPPTQDPATEPGTAPASVEELLAAAGRLFDEAQAAKAVFDTKTYEQKIEQAYELLRQATEVATGGEVTDRRRLTVRTAGGSPVDTPHPGRCQTTTTVVPTWAKSHRKSASRFACRWQPPDKRVPSSASVWYGESSSTCSGMAWNPMWPMSVADVADHLRQPGLAVPRRRHVRAAVDLVGPGRLVAVLAARDEPRADDRAVLADGPYPLAGPLVHDPPARPGVLRQRRSIATGGRDGRQRVAHQIDGARRAAWECG